MPWGAEVKEFFESPSSYVAAEAFGADNPYSQGVGMARDTAHDAFESYLGVPGLSDTESMVSGELLGCSAADVAAGVPGCVEPEQPGVHPDQTNTRAREGAAPEEPDTWPTIAVGAAVAVALVWALTRRN